MNNDNKKSTQEPDGADHIKQIKKLFESVDRFALQMKRKLSRKCGEGKRGWDDPNWPKEDKIKYLIEHAERGDWIDAANIAMFGWNQEDTK